MQYIICMLICSFLIAGCQQKPVKKSRLVSATSTSLSADGNIQTDKQTSLTGQGRETLLQTKINDQYSFRTYKDPEGGVGCEILQNGKAIYTAGGVACSISGEKLEGRIVFPPVGKNVTGDGNPNLVVGCITGGSHCCTEITIFSLGNSLKIVKEIQCPYCTFKLVDLEKDGIYELIISDWTFQTWGGASGAGEGYANQDVILRYKNGDYQVDPDLMKKYPKKIDPPSLNTISGEFGDSRFDPRNPQEGLYELSRYMLALIYNGRGNEAFDFCHTVWPKNHKGEEVFVDAFKQQLSKSPHWQGIRTLNGW